MTFLKKLLEKTTYFNRKIEKKGCIAEKIDRSDRYYWEVAKQLRSEAKRGGRVGDEELMSQAPVKPGQNILDVGMGAGIATKFFLEKGLNVSATGIFGDEFGANLESLVKNGVTIKDCYVENLLFDNEEFDAVWMSHVLEHTMNPGIALQEVWRVLKPGGWLFVIVPPYKSKIVGGHLMTGWNIGQIMYVLLLSQFNVKDGHFVHLEYNVAAFVQKSTVPLPKVQSDIGDIEMLSNFWPIELKQGFEGTINSINWPPKF